MSNGSTLVEEVYRDYGDKIRGYVHSHIGNPEDAEDVASSVFLKITERSGSFDASKSSISTWVFTITKNTVIDFYRRRRVTEEIPETVADETEGSLEALCNEETLAELAKALEKIPERLRDVIIFRYYHGMKLKDVAVRMDMSYANVKILHKKALAELRRYM